MILVFYFLGPLRWLKNRNIFFIFRITNHSGPRHTLSTNLTTRSKANFHLKGFLHLIQSNINQYNEPKIKFSPFLYQNFRKKLLGRISRHPFLSPELFFSKKLNGLVTNERTVVKNLKRFNFLFVAEKKTFLMSFIFFTEALLKLVSW